MDRRQAIAAAGSLLATATAGCVSSGSDDDEEPPKPVVEAVRVPAVERVDGDGMHFGEPIDASADAEPEFAATFENAGDAGDAAISLYLLEATGADGDVYTADAPARVTVVPFAAGQRREVAFDDVSTDGYDVYYFEAQVGSVEADVRNDGAAGRVEITLTGPDGEPTDKRQTLELDADATETVTFDGAFMQDAYDVRAAAADE